MQSFFVLGILTLLSSYFVVLNLNSNLNNSIRNKSLNNYAQNYIYHNNTAARFIINKNTTLTDVYMNGKNISSTQCQIVPEANILGANALLNYQTIRCYDFNQLTKNTSVYLIVKADLPAAAPPTLNIQMILTKMKESLSSKYFSGSDESYYSNLIVSVNQSCVVTENYTKLPSFKDNSQLTNYNNMITSLCNAAKGAGLSLNNSPFNGLYLKNITR